MKHRRVKALHNPTCTYLVLEEGVYDIRIECLDWQWRHDFENCTEEDLIKLPTATQVLTQIKQKS